MSSAFERMQKLAEQKKKAQLELVPSPNSGKPQLGNEVNQLQNNAVNHTNKNEVNQTSPSVVNPTQQDSVNRNAEILFTTNPDVVNNPTTVEENVNLFTTNKAVRGK